METKKNLKEQKRQTYLEPHQINVNLIKKLDKLPTGEIVIAINVEKKHTWIVCDSGRTYKSIHTIINNEMISYIEFFNQQDDHWTLLVIQLKEKSTENGITQKLIAERTGLKQEAVSRFFSLRIKPTLDTFMKIANAINVKISIVI